MLVLSAATASTATSPIKRLVGKPLGHLRRPTVQGGRFDSAKLAGRVLLIDIFAAYCKPCQRRLPKIERLRREQPKLVVLGVSLDETADAARAQARRWQLGFPIIHDAGHVLAGRWRVTELPAALIVDQQGRIAWVGNARHTEQELRHALNQVLRNRTRPRDGHQR